MAASNLLRYLQRSFSTSYTVLQRSAPKPRVFDRTFEVSDNLAKEDIFNSDHVELRRSLRKLIDKEVNPYVEDWEKEGLFPAHEVFKKLGNAGFLGVNKPVEYGGQGLDFSYAVALHEEMGK